jgi:integron integrase
MSEFIEEVRSEMRVRRLSLKTEKAYLGWIKQFIRFHELKHPKELGNTEIEHFLHYLANDRKVSASTQTQALCALVFMYKKVLAIDISGLKYGHANKAKRLPIIIDMQEARLIIEYLTGKHQLIGKILLGAGLRINEALKLRIKDINFTNGTIFVFKGKGDKDRYTILPESIVPALKDQINYSIKLHGKDLREGHGLSSMPTSLIKKYKKAAKDQSWQYIFPSPVRCHHPIDGYVCRHHLHDSSFAKNLRRALKDSKINKRVTAHVFRHTFATQLLLNGTDIRTLQELLGHSDIRTTEIYTHVVGNKFAGTKSPVDF